MNEDLKNMILKIADDSYKSGFSDACGIISTGLDFFKKKGVEKMTIAEFQSILDASVKLSNEKFPDWSKYGL